MTAAGPAATYGVGIDSGQDGAWVLVRSRPGHRCELLELHQVHGTKDGAWLHRAMLGAERCWHRLVAELGDVRRAAEVTVWVETPPAFSRTLPGGGRHTQASWVGLGRRVGMLQALWWCASERTSEADRVEVSTWTRAFGSGVLRSHKVNDGWHRVQEAEALVAGLTLEGVPRGRRVDVAESVLIAAGAARFTVAEVGCS